MCTWRITSMMYSPFGTSWLAPHPYFFALIHSWLCRSFYPLQDFGESSASLNPGREEGECDKKKNRNAIRILEPATCLILSADNVMACWRQGGLLFFFSYLQKNCSKNDFRLQVSRNWTEKHLWTMWAVCRRSRAKSLRSSRNSRKKTIAWPRSNKSS